MDQQIPKVLLPLANGFEEIETVSIIDLLRRAQAQVTVASIMGKAHGLILTGGQDIELKANKFWEDIDEQYFDLIVCSGGIKNAVSLGSFQP
jgi:4-methyl-5(b-hydroxyethyl)-thiazole monophosphate biosynthesis